MEMELRLQVECVNCRHAVPRIVNNLIISTIKILPNILLLIEWLLQYSMTINYTLKLLFQDGG